MPARHYLLPMTDDAPAKPCPICGKPADAKAAPFCSPRCADVDLNRWLVGAYAIPASEDDDAAEAEGTATRESGQERDA